MNVKNYCLKKIRIVVASKTDNTLLQFIRYTFVGSFAFAVDFGGLAFFTECVHLHYLVSNIISFLLGLAVNYLLSIKWVFSTRTLDNRCLEFLLFLVIGIIGLGLNELFLWLFTGMFHVFYLFSKMVTAVVVYLWNFFARKIVLFNKNSCTNE